MQAFFARFLKAPVPTIVDGVKLPDRVWTALDGMRAWIDSEAESGNFDLWSYCNWPLDRRAFHALAELTLSGDGFAELRAKILKLEKAAEIEEVPDEADEATKGRDDEEDKGDGERCKHADENGRCANPNMNGGGFVCCHCAGFEPADDGEAVPF